MLRTVARTLAGVQTPEGDGMVVRRAFPNQAIARIDPFLMLDEMGPMELRPGRDPGFPDHPHRGFETVTYMLDGEFEHRDSHGHAGRLGPGDVQWMTAGAGVVHSEMPSARIRKEGGRIHGLQLWVNLPKADKMMPPRYQEFPAASIPEVEVPGGRVRVIAGSFGGREAVIDTRIRIQYLHARLDAGAKVVLPAPSDHAGFVYAITGGGEVGGKPVAGGHLALLADGGDEVELHAGPEGLQAILVTGTPIREPIFQYGPFVMTTREEIVQAVEDFRAGKFGEIAATH